MKFFFVFPPFSTPFKMHFWLAEVNRCGVSGCPDSLLRVFLNFFKLRFLKFINQIVVCEVEEDEIPELSWAEPAGSKQKKWAKKPKRELARLKGRKKEEEEKKKLTTKIIRHRYVPKSYLFLGYNEERSRTTTTIQCVSLDSPSYVRLFWLKATWYDFRF